jgi:uncharacterized protein (TIGR03083 family)
MSHQGLRAVEVLIERYTDVVRSLQPDEWGLPSRCAGWSVQDLVAHTGSNLRVVADPGSGPADPPLVAEELQELLVRERRGWTAQQVVEEFEHYAQAALPVFRSIQEQPAAASPLTLSELGTYPLHNLADAFAFDMWCHLYVDLLAPTGPVERPVGEPEDEVLRPGIGWMLAGLPQMCPSVSKVLYAPIALRLTGAGGGDWTLRPGEPLVVDEGHGSDAAAVVTSSAVDFVLWGTTRTRWRDAVSLDGDTAYAERVLDEIDIV